MKITRLNSDQADFSVRLDALLARLGPDDEEVTQSVTAILRDVQLRGDQALLEYTQTFDRLTLDAAAALEIPAARQQEALTRIPAAQREALEKAVERLRHYAGHQRMQSWRYRDEFGNELGQEVRPLDRVGVYVPGGKAAYPSSVLMNVVPARVAGVAEVIMCVPTPDGRVNDMVLAAAAIAGVDRVFTLGGAQAVGALAYGTETVPAVDKIVGPGNRFVAAAKRLVYGIVGIDMIAGPSEILVVCDGNADADWVAMDMFAQAEHDEDAQAILVCPDADFIEKVLDSAERQLADLPRAAIITASMAARGAVVQVRDLEEALAVVNQVAPEHLEVSVADPEAFISRVRHAGAMFLGRYSAEVLGDYCAGPNHVLPTARSARFSSPLGVYDFQKRSSVIYCSPQGAAELAPVAAELARGEGLEAHARSAEYRGRGEG